jgi:hypothetical protein
MVSGRRLLPPTRPRTSRTGQRIVSVRGGYRIGGNIRDYAPCVTQIALYEKRTGESNQKPRWSTDLPRQTICDWDRRRRPVPYAEDDYLHPSDAGRSGSAAILSEQATLAPVWVSAGNKRIPEAGQFLRCVMPSNFHDLGPCQLIAMFIVGMSHMTLKPLPGDSM